MTSSNLSQTFWRSPAAWLLAALLVLLSTAVAPTPAGADATIPRAQLEKALKKQRRLVKNRPHKATLWNDLANLLYLAENYEQAEEAYRQSLDLDPELVSARFNLALLLLEDGRNLRARRVLKRVLKQRPRHAWSHYYMGVAQDEAGRRAAAIKHYSRALRLDPRLTDPRVNPHVIDNELIANATMHAYAELPGAALAPRIYENRKRIVDAMIGAKELRAQLEAQSEAQESAEGAAAAGDAAAGQAGDGAASRPQREGAGTGGTGASG